MPVWLSQNWGNIIVLGVIALAVFWIVISQVKKKKQGKSACGCGCTQCAMKDICHGEKTAKSLDITQ